MLTDTWTVVWKEWREWVLGPNAGRLGWRHLVMVAITGVLFPLQSGPEWFKSWLSVYMACFPVIILLNLTADSFAGERERHTLETLLATRLPDRAIVLGKTLAIVGFGWGLVMLGAAVSVVSLNLANRGGGLLFFEPRILAAIATIALVGALLLSSVGVLLSMNAETVRQAAQRMMLPFLAMVALPGFVPIIAEQLPASAVTALAGMAAFVTPARVVTTIALVFGVAAICCLWLAMARFQRSRLIA